MRAKVPITLITILHWRKRTVQWMNDLQGRHGVARAAKNISILWMSANLAMTGIKNSSNEDTCISIVSRYILHNCCCWDVDHAGILNNWWMAFHWALKPQNFRFFLQYFEMLWCWQKKNQKSYIQKGSTCFCFMCFVKFPFV